MDKYDILYRIKRIKGNINMITDDFKHDRETPFTKKVWAWTKGFHSYRIRQYGLNRENVHEFLSDSDYRKLFPINNEYAKWINDKLTVRYVLSPYAKYFPKVYFLLTKEKSRSVLRLPDCPELPGLTTDITGIIRLLQETGTLALKPLSEYGGKGFCKLAYQNDTYFLNDQKVEREKVEKQIKDSRNHLISEYIINHPFIRNIYPNSLNTCRLMVINSTGENPEIVSAVLRVGTSKSGVVDNATQEGCFCIIDEQSGVLIEPLSLANHVLSPSLCHPDTGTPLQGRLPNWEEVCQKVLEMSRFISPIRYMGYDVAITSDGFKIIEINSHQGLFRFPGYNDKVKAFFTDLVEEKRNKFKFNYQWKNAQ